VVRSAPPRSRAGLHLLLAVATLFTLAIAGGAFWEGVIFSFGDLLEPGVLLSVVSAGLPYAIWCFAILGCHEMGHYLACRYYGIPATLPFFLPSIPPLGTFGAVIRIRGVIPHRRALFDIAAAGPIAGFVVAVPVLIYGVLTATPAEPLPEIDGTGLVRLGEPLLLTLITALLPTAAELTANGWIGAGWVGLLVTSLNLFPAGQLDGGHVAYAISREAHRRLARLSLYGVAGVILIQIWLFEQFPVYVVWLLILLWMRDRHPRLRDEETPLGTGRKLVALLLAVVFVLSFVLMPLYVD
jgi:membrane-associated protease RseP (regulator of RpoE activity)